MPTLLLDSMEFMIENKTFTPSGPEERESPWEEAMPEPHPPAPERGYDDGGRAVSSRFDLPRSVADVLEKLLDQTEKSRFSTEKLIAFMESGKPGPGYTYK